MDLRRLLSPAQHEAATRTDAPVCILAGAGSGKTRVITHRIAWLVEDKGAAPWTILAVTFTNKAAGEMRSRVDKLVPGRGQSVQVGTFHGLAARILRKHGRAVGVPASFVIYDEDDADRLLKRVITQELNWNAEIVRPVRTLIDDWQSHGWTAEQVPGFKDAFTEKALAVYKLYAERLQGMGALDFGALLVKLRDLLKLPSGRDVTDRIRHVLVDEYQDVNAVQAEIVMMLGKAAETIAVVGDDDQAIYGWRGASAENLRRFLEAMPGAVLVKLEENYRSTSTILAAANGIIARNEIRLGKTLRATGPVGRRVEVMRARDDLDEARRIAAKIEEHARRGGSLDEVAILYRTNALSRPFEDELRKAGLPYRIVGGVRFYDRKEVKDVLATLRAALNPDSDVDTLRMLTAVPRGIGATTIEKIEREARARGSSLLRAIADADLLEAAGLQKRAVSKATAVAGRMLDLGRRLRGHDGAAALSAPDAVALAIDVSGVADRLEAEATIEAEGRLEILDELRNAAAEHANQARLLGQPDDVESFLEAASLLSSTDLSAKDDGRGQVTLMSLHAAKGLEYDLVFLVALEEHGFPHARALADGATRDDLEEERRLAYVGITRARQHLVVSYAERRMVKGNVMSRQPSRFLAEMPAEALDGDVVRPVRPALSFSRGFSPSSSGYTPSYGRHPEPDDEEGPTVEYDPEFAPGRGRKPKRTILFSDDEPAAAPRVDAAGPAAAEAAAGALSSGARVWHKSFGEGTIVGLRGAGRLAAALVRFEDDRQPRVIIARHLTVLADDGEGTRIVPDETA